MSKFTAVIDDFIAKSNARIEYVVKDSAQRVINEAQTPVAKGGKMRVDTGFLINSGMAQIGGMPSGNGVNPNKGGPKKQWGRKNKAAAAVVINRLRVGETLYFGWVANYAKYRENKDGFMRLAAMNWQTHVKKSISAAKRALK